VSFAVVSGFGFEAALGGLHFGIGGGVVFSESLFAAFP
jgi:hypothetical protein